MKITYIIKIVTFISALIEKFSKKPVSERRWIFRSLKLENVTIVLLGLLLIFQLWDSRNTSAKEEKNENQSEETYKKVITTHEKINEAHILIEKVIQNINTEIQFTKEEFDLIGNLNKDMRGVRTSIEKNLKEYNNLNSQYEKQINIEKEKIHNAKPDLRVTNPKSIIDTISFSFQFTFSNYGNRNADSIKYYSAMIFIDSTLNIKKIGLVKTNISEHNVLSIPGDKDFEFYINSPDISKKEVKSYYLGFLLVKYCYKDDMTGILHEPELKVFKCLSFEKNNIQFGQNIESEVVSRIKQFLYFNNRNYHDIFFYK